MGLKKMYNVRHVGHKGAVHGDRRLAVSGEIQPTKVAYATIRVNEMPAVDAYSTSCTS
jgi:hypothetical protein